MAKFIFQIPAGTVAPSAALELTDASHGNIGLIGPATILLHLDEPNGVRPSDAMGNLASLAVSGEAPVLAAAFTGRGRDFTAGQGLQAADLAGRDTLNVRDVTVQAIIAVRPGDIADSGTIIARGLDGSAAEYVSYGLEVVPDGNEIGVRWIWQDSTGTLRLAPLGTYEHPGDDHFVLLTATRRWESTARVVVRYYLGEVLLGEYVSTHGDIAGGTTGTTTIGRRRTAGVWGNEFAGVLDDLKVTDYEMSADEVRATWHRLALWQPAGVEMLRGLLPPGLSWMRDPSTRIGRLMRVTGQGLGFVMAKADELRATWLPGTAYKERAAQWERLRGLSPRPRDTLDTRRARVAGLFAREQGYSLPAVTAALRDVIPAPSPITILEYTNEVRDWFADEIAPERWHIEPAAAWSAGGSNDAVLEVAAATNMQWIAGDRRDYHIRTPLSASTGEVVVAGEVLSVPQFPTDVLVGLFLFDYLRGEALWFGVRNDAGTYRVSYRSVVGATYGAVVDLAAPAYDPADPIWLRAVREPDTPGRWRLEYSVTSATAGWVTATVDGLVDAPTNAGFAGLGLDASTAGALEAHFTEFLSRTPDGDRPFHWYAVIESDEDVRGAQSIVSRVKPAHMHAAAISSLSTLCDDPSTPCDRGPLGGH